jgi:endonuclease III
MIMDNGPWYCRIITRMAIASESTSAGRRNLQRRRRARLRRVVTLLDDAYGRPHLTPRFPPLDELIYTVLSQNTADVNTDRSFAALKERFATWSAVRDAPVDEIESAIALGGLAHTKAPRIKAILRALSESGGEPGLERLDAMADAEAQTFLVSLPGVGPKTAACVLLFSLGRPLMPVDTHVHRLARRLDLIDAGVGADAAHEVLTGLAGPGAAEIYAAHVDLVRHGRRVCRARRPACDRCPLAGLCPSAFAV